MGLEEDEEFVIAEKRHREIIKAIKSSFRDEPKEKIDLSGIQDSIGELSKSFEAVLDKIKPQQPTNNSEQLVALSQAIKQLENNLGGKLDRLSNLIEIYNQPREIDIKVDRSMGDGRISGLKGRQYFKTVGKA